MAVTSLHCSRLSPYLAPRASAIWCGLYMSLMLDGTLSDGAHGQASFLADMLTIQLPSDKRVFLQRIPTVTEPLVPMLSPLSLSQHTNMSSTLGIGCT